MHIILNNDPVIEGQNHKGFFMGDIYAPLPCSKPEYFFDLISHQKKDLKNFLNKQIGEFSFVYKDRSTGHIYFGRDTLGIIPLYYTQLKNKTWLFATTLEEIVKNQPNLSLNKKYLNSIFGMKFESTHSSPYKNVFRCPAGSYGYICDEEVQIKRYWQVSDIDKSKMFDSLEDCIIEGQALLEKVIEDRLFTGKKINVFLSGGLDSSLISSVLDEKYDSWTSLKIQYNELISKRDKPFAHHQYLQQPVYTSLRFQTKPEDDPEGIQLLKKKLKYQPNEIFAENIPENQWQYNIHEDPKIIFYEPNHWLFKPMLRECLKMKAQLVLTGLGGDDLFEVTPEIISRLNKQERRQYYDKYPFFSKKWPIVEWCWLCQIKPFLIFFRSLVAKILFPIERVIHWRHTQPIIRTISYKFITSGKYQFGFENEQEFSQKYGVRMSYPLMDKRIIEYLIKIPTRFHFLAGMDNTNYTYHTKPILRAIAKKFLPYDLAKRQSVQNYLDFRNKIVTRLKVGQLSAQHERINFNKGFVEPELCYLYTNMCIQQIRGEQR